MRPGDPNHSISERVGSTVETLPPNRPVSLDNGHQNCTLYLCRVCQARDRKRRRTFQRVISGLKRGGEFKFITLTTSEESWQAGKDIQESWRALKERLGRRGLISGYVKVKEFTKRGYPHLHIIVRGRWIPQMWLSQVWADIHLSPVVDVRRVQAKDGAAGYLSKYLGKDTRAKCSWGWTWVWPGFVRDWKRLQVELRYLGGGMVGMIRVWDAILEHYDALGREGAALRVGVSFG